MRDIYTFSHANAPINVYPMGVGGGGECGQKVGNII